MSLATSVVETNPTEEVRGLPRAVGISVAALVARQGVAKLIGLVGSIILARILYPADFGVFAIASLLFGFFTLLSDLGLGSSLIQQHDKPSVEELRAIFTFQQVIVGFAAVTIFVAAPIVAHAYHLDTSALWLMRFMSLYLVVLSLRSLPVVLLTRRVDFFRVAVVDVVSVLTYQVVTIVAARAGLRFWSLGLGLLLSTAVAALLINVVAPWPIGLRWDWPTVRAHMRFGIPYQGTVLVAALELAAAPIVLGLLAGSAAVGFAGFAFSIANLGLIVPNLVVQVGFPAMSRVQSDPARLGRSLEIALKVTCYACCSVYLPLLLAGRGIVHLVFSARWLPAVPLLSLLLVSWLLRSVFSTGGVALSAMGKSRLNFWLHLALALVSWALVLVLVPSQGFIGLGQAWLLAAIPLPGLFIYLNRILPLRITDSVLRPLALFVVTYGLSQLYFILNRPNEGWSVLLAGLVLLLFLVEIAVVERQSLGYLRAGLARLAG